jgi:hypothetical protein
MPKDPLFPREVHQGAIGGSFAKDYFERYPKDQYQTEIESWRHPQSANIEFTVKRRRELP